MKNVKFFGLVFLVCALCAILCGLMERTNDLRVRVAVLEKERQNARELQESKDRDDVMRLIAMKYAPPPKPVTTPFPQVEEVTYPLKQGNPIYDR